MNTSDALQLAQSLLQSITGNVQRPAANRLDAIVPRERLLESVKALCDARWGYLSAITGLDAGSGLEALYHFSEGEAVTTVRVAVPYDDARVPSICSVVPAATLYECELSEMFGVTVEGTPIRDHLLLPDEWPQGVYPLRKAFKSWTKQPGNS